VDELSGGGEAATQALRELGGFVSGLRWQRLTVGVRRRFELVLADSLGVMIAGSRTPELNQLLSAWGPAPGPARLLGHGSAASVADAVVINGAALCCMELDEGSKHARGHPGAHALPMALALAAELEVDGPAFLGAALAGHEVAARFGRATRLAVGVHPHGTWGVAGAAATASALLGLGAEATAGALDAAAGLALAAPFECALAGSFVRNAWVGVAGNNGLTAARLAAAGLATPDGTAGHSLGRLLGEFDPAELTAALGRRFDVEHGYLKLHACCSFTHPPADAALLLRQRHPGLEVEEIESVAVETHRLAAPLDRTATPTRLAAMFSIPYVTAAALSRGRCGPPEFDAPARSDGELAALAGRVQVRRTEEMDARLPDRAARVIVTLHSGEEIAAEVPNPVGDSDHHPLGEADLDAKLAVLGVDPSPIWRLVRSLGEAPSAAAVIAELP
jgi:2-methylcitrate dehydratase PrpD